MPLESFNDPALRETLVSFLLATFRLTPEAPFVQPALLRWKYDEPRPDWSGPRSFIWKNGHAITAHACMCPVTYAPGQFQTDPFPRRWKAPLRLPRNYHLELGPNS